MSKKKNKKKDKKLKRFSFTIYYHGYDRRAALLWYAQQYLLDDSVNDAELSTILRASDLERLLEIDKVYVKEKEIKK